MQKALLVIFVIVCLVAYVESKKQSEGKKEEAQGKDEKRGQKDHKQKEGQESKKGKERKTKEDVNQEKEQGEKYKGQKEKYKGKQERNKRDEKSEKSSKDAEKKQQKKDHKQEESETETESCSKDACKEVPQPETTATVCITHSDCQPGSCCKAPGVCEQIQAREGQQCWNSCMCGGGLLCFSDGAKKDTVGVCKVPAPEDLAQGGTYLQ